MTTNWPDVVPVLVLPAGASKMSEAEMTALKKRSEQPAMKDDADKPRYDLLPWVALEQVALVMAFGAVKYSAHNWRKGLGWARLGRAVIGHTALWLRGEEKDPESGLSHLAHAGASALMLLESTLIAVGPDDRWKKP